MRPLPFLLLTGLLAACAAPPPPPRPVEPLPEAPLVRIHPKIVREGWEQIGVSVEGREIEARTFGTGPVPVFLVGGIHGNEMEGTSVLDRVLEELDSRGAFDSVTLRVVRNLNPDGTDAGIRNNARGVDLNRNWPAPNFEASRAHGSAPLSEPETVAAHADLVVFGPETVIVLHSARSGPFVNYDGPASDLARVFADGASRADSRWRVVADVGYPTPGSLGSFIGHGEGLPILTIEFRRGQDSTSAYPALLAGMESLLGVLPAWQRPPVPAR